MTSDQSPGEPLRMTPGPTEMPTAVRERMAQPAPNPDIEPAFFERYRALTANLETVFGTDGVVILGGEGILGLEAAVASILEPGAGDRVLCLSNGLYGDGFADFVELYGGTPELVRSPAEKPFDLAALESTLEAEEFLAATVVHCETPTGVCNNLDPVLELLEAHDVLRIVDAVSSLGGTAVPAEKIDICLGASQKCFSAPPGLTVASVSDRAWERIEATETPSFYANLEPWKDALAEEWFPYTHLASNVLALEAAIELLLEEGLESVFERHEAAAALCRSRAAEYGLSTVAEKPELASPTVTALSVPGEATTIQHRLLEEHNILLATGLGEDEDDILRVGHMGHNARREQVERTMDAVGEVLAD